MNWRKFFGYKSGIVLSGGAARGIAHIGALKALHEHDIFPQIVSGVSAGSIAGVLYADGYTPDQILERFMNKKIFHFVRVTFPKDGFFRMEGLQDFLEEHLQARYFHELKLPLYVGATNYNWGRIEYFHKGSLIDKIIASSSIPLLFYPVKIGDYHYFDGGVVDNFPVEPIRKRCRRLIGIHVNPTGYESQCSGMMKIAVRTFHISATRDLYLKKKYCHLFIEPQDLKENSLWDISKVEALYDSGYQETKRKLKHKRI